MNNQTEEDFLNWFRSDAENQQPHLSEIHNLSRSHAILPPPRNHPTDLSFLQEASSLNPYYRDYYNPNNGSRFSEYGGLPVKMKIPEESNSDSNSNLVLKKSTTAKSGFAGVDWHEGLWRARVKKGDKRIALPGQPTPNAAARLLAKYKKTKKKTKPGHIPSLNLPRINKSRTVSTRPVSTRPGSTRPRSSRSGSSRPGSTRPGSTRPGSATRYRQNFKCQFCGRVKQFTSKSPESRVVIRCQCRNSKSQQHTYWEETNEDITNIPTKIQGNALPRFTNSINNEYLQQFSPTRFTKGTRKPPTERREVEIPIKKYRCGYCGAIKESTSMGFNGRVRIRCECGGHHENGKPRMHANWKSIDQNEL